MIASTVDYARRVSRRAVRSRSFWAAERRVFPGVSFRLIRFMLDALRRRLIFHWRGLVHTEVSTLWGTWNGQTIHAGSPPGNRLLDQILRKFRVDWPKGFPRRNWRKIYTMQAGLGGSMRACLLHICGIYRGFRST